MPMFIYTAATAAGKTVRGKREAADKADLSRRLRGEGLYLLTTKSDVADTALPRLKPKDLTYFNRQLSAMLSSGISLIRSIEIILRRDLPRKQRAVYESLHRSLLDGIALSDAMEALGPVFPPLLVNMYRAGEANGTLDLTAGRMADHYEKEHRLRSKIKSATAYPMVLLCLTVGIMIVIFVFVLPTFLDIFGNMELPKITRVVIAISNLFTQDYFKLLLFVAGLLLVIVLLRMSRGARKFFDRLKLKLPGFRNLMRIIYTARFARTLSSLYASGLNILTALQISRGTVGNLYIADQFEKVIASARQGGALSEALEQVDGYDKKLPSAVLVGEESGRLETMLLSVADSFDYEAEQATQRLTALIEPLLIIIMAALIGGVVIAVMLPIYNMYNSISAM